MRLDLKELSAVEDAVNAHLHVITLVGILWHEIIEGRIRPSNGIANCYWKEGSLSDASPP
jgi:hypothetical protein